MFIHDFPNNFFNDIFDSNYASRTPILISHYGHMGFISFKISQQIANFSVLRRIIRVSQDVSWDLDERILAPQLQKIFCMQDTCNLVDIVVMDRDSGVTAIGDQLDNFA